MDYQDDENKTALFSIANEIKKFHIEQNKRENVKTNIISIFDNLQWYKSTIKVKKKQLAYLKKKLHVACILTKILLTSKSIDKAEICQLNTLNHTTKNQELENKTYHDMASSKLINVAYKQFCFNQDESQVREIDKLREIICLLNATITNVTQEKLKAETLERKNKFLTMKLILTENHVEYLLKQNNLRKKKSFNLNKINEFQKHRIDLELYSDPRVQNNTLNSVLLNEKPNIKFHLSNMKLLVYEQGNSLKELARVSKEFESDSKVAL